MTDLEITRFKRNQVMAAYRARIRAKTSKEEITWHPIPGPKLPDDEMTVIIQIGFDDDAEFYAAYILAGEWYYANGAECCSIPVAWSHMPKGISSTKYNLMLAAQRRSGCTRKSTQPTSTVGAEVTRL